MKTKRLVCVLLLIGLLFTFVACGKKDDAKTAAAPKADDFKWPTQPITLYVSSSAGGPNDTMCRIVGAALEKKLGVTVTVVNKPGGSSWTAGDTLLSGKKDGYEFASVVLPAFHKGYLDPAQTRKETAENFIYLANFAEDTNICYIRSDETRFSDMAGFVEYAKNNELTVSATGVASDDDACIQKLLVACPGMKLSTVFVTGSAESLTGVLGGHIDVGIGNIGDIATSVSDGSIKVLCVFAEERNTKYLPDVPTFNELKISETGAIADSKRGFFYPEGVDERIVKIMTNALTEVYNDADVQAQFENAGIPLHLYTGDEYKQVVRDEAKVMESLAGAFGWK